MIQPEHSANYNYDSVYRLSQVTAPGSSWGISWTFDTLNNRLTQTPTGLATEKVGTQTNGYYQPDTNTAPPIINPEGADGLRTHPNANVTSGVAPYNGDLRNVPDNVKKLTCAETPGKEIKEAAALGAAGAYAGAQVGPVGAVVGGTLGAAAGAMKGVAMSLPRAI